MKTSGFQLKSLKGEKRFSELYSKGKKVSTQKLLMIVEFADNAGENIDVIEFAVVIGKRTSKSAVIRNRIKRLLRESIRLKFPLAFGDIDNLPVKSFIVNWRQAPSHPKLIKLAEVAEEMTIVFDKLKKRFR